MQCLITLTAGFSYTGHNSFLTMSYTQQFVVFRFFVLLPHLVSFFVLIFYDSFNSLAKKYQQIYYKYIFYVNNGKLFL